MDDERFNGSNSWTPILADDGQTLFVMAIDYYSKEWLGEMAKYPLFVARAETPLQSQQLDIITFEQNENYVMQDNYRYGWCWPQDFYVTKNELGKFELHLAVLQEQYFEYDAAENTIQAVNARTAGGVICPVYYIDTMAHRFIKAGADTVLYLVNDGGGSQSVRLLTYSTDNKILCTKRTVNGSKELYMIDVARVSPSDVADGWLDVTTQITPAVPDSASNAQADSASGAEEGSAAAGATPQAQAAAADAEGSDA